MATPEIATDLCSSYVQASYMPSPNLQTNICQRKWKRCDIVCQILDQFKQKTKDNIVLR